MNTFDRTVKTGTVNVVAVMAGLAALVMAGCGGSDTKSAGGTGGRLIFAVTVEAHVGWHMGRHRSANER